MIKYEAIIEFPTTDAQLLLIGQIEEKKHRLLAHTGRRAKYLVVGKEQRRVILINEDHRVVSLCGLEVFTSKEESALEVA